MWVHCAGSNRRTAQCVATVLCTSGASRRVIGCDATALIAISVQALPSLPAQRDASRNALRPQHKTDCTICQAPELRTHPRLRGHPAQENETGLDRPRLVKPEQTVLMAPAASSFDKG